MIMIGLKKAFDTVCHKLLVKKLYHYGIRGVANSLISSSLHNRKQYVSLNRVNSEVKSVDMWVPQGSIFGPFLYVMYVNDLPNAIDCTSRLYADDTCLIVHDAIVTNLEHKITINLEKFKIWLDANYLTINLNKTACILIPYSTKTTEYNFNPSFDGISINKVSSFKYLGIIIDNQLMFILNYLRKKFHVMWEYYGS